MVIVRVLVGEKAALGLHCVRYASSLMHVQTAGAISLTWQLEITVSRVEAHISKSRATLTKIVINFAPPA